MKALSRILQRHFHSTQISRIDAKKVKEVQIPVPWGHIAGRWWGERDVVPAIGLHGLLDNAATFDNLVPLLETPAFLSLDLPGHGQSSHFPKGIVCHLFDHLIALRFLLKNHFGWERPTLIGHSFGGCLWFLYSTLYPDEVGRYVSIDGATYTIAAKEHRAASHTRRVIEAHMKFEAKINNAPPEYELEGLVELMHESRVSSGLHLDRDACRTLLTRGAQKNPSTGKYYLTRDLRLNSKALGTPTPDFLFALSERMKAKVLYIRATNTIVMGDWLKWYEKSVGIMRNAGASVEDIQVEGGHHVHLENARNVAPVINRFLNA